MTTLRPSTRAVTPSGPAAPLPQRVELSIDSIALRGLPDPGPLGRKVLVHAAQRELGRLIAAEHPAQQAQYSEDSVRAGTIFAASDPRRLGESIARAIHRGLKRG